MLLRKKTDNMKCPKEIRLCPNGWEDCSLCKYDVLCKAGLYEPDISDLGIVVLAAKIAEKVMQAEAIESAHKIRGTWMEEFNQLPEGEIWEWMARYKRPGDFNYKEPLKAGPSEPGGGSKSRCKKSTKGNIPTVYIWGSTD